MTQGQTYNVDKADRAYEFYLLLVTIIQAVLFQLMTWFLEKPAEMYEAIGYALVFSLPQIISLILWIKAILEDINENSIKLRLLSWGITDASLSFSIILLAALAVFKISTISVNLGVLVVVGGIILYYLFTNSIRSISEFYKKDTSYLPLWTRKISSNWHFLSYSITMIVITFILVVYS